MKKRIGLLILLACGAISMFALFSGKKKEMTLADLKAKKPQYECLAGVSY